MTLNGLRKLYSAELELKTRKLRIKRNDGSGRDRVFRIEDLEMADYWNSIKLKEKVKAPLGEVGLVDVNLYDCSEMDKKSRYHLCFYPVHEDGKGGYDMDPDHWVRLKLKVIKE